MSRRHPDASNTSVSRIISHTHTHTPTHANNRLSHHYVNQISLHSRCCIAAPSIIQRCSHAHQGAATTNGNCLLISRAPLHLCISVSRLSGRASRAPWCVPLRLVEKPFEPEMGLLFLRDSQRDTALHKATAPIDPLRVACGQRHVSRARAPVLAHLRALPARAALVRSVR